MDQKIQFFTEDTNFKISGKNKIRNWVNVIFQEEKKKHSQVNFIFCNDEYLLNLNKVYLDRDYLTDVISFSFTKNSSRIVGDIYISIDRVEENAEKYKQKFSRELLRVIAHGTLHLIGYKDSYGKDKKLMREKENMYLKLIKL